MAIGLAPPNTESTSSYGIRLGTLTAKLPASCLRPSVPSLQSIPAVADPRHWATSRELSTLPDDCPEALFNPSLEEHWWCLNKVATVIA